MERNAFQVGWLRKQAGAAGYGVLESARTSTSERHGSVRVRPSIISSTLACRSSALVRCFPFRLSIPFKLGTWDLFSLCP